MKYIFSLFHITILTSGASTHSFVNIHIIQTILQKKADLQQCVDDAIRKWLRRLILGLGDIIILTSIISILADPSSWESSVM